MSQPAELIYRRATTADLNALKDLALSSYGVFSSALSPDNWEVMRSRISTIDLFSQLLSTSAAFVCSHNGKLAGMAFLVRSGVPHPLYEADWSVIRMLGVDPAYTGRGIAVKLTQLCIDEARRTGEKVIGLHTSPEIMPNAIRIYEKAGFQFYKNIDPIFGVKYQLFRMHL